MKRDELIHIIHYYFNKLHTNSEQIKKGFDKESIHNFRVEFKKLRAFMRMIRTSADEPQSLKFPRRFKKMYATIGKIRDRQLCLERIKQDEKEMNDNLSAKVHLLKKEISELQKKNSDFLSEKDFENIEQDIIKQLPIDNKNEVVKIYFQQKLKAINEVAVKRDFGDKELHNTRKSIKDIIYIMRVYRDDLKTSLPCPFWNEDDLKKAETFSHKLGLFNDVCIALTLLKEEGKQKQLQAIRRQWLAEKRRLKKEIVDTYLSNYNDSLFKYPPCQPMRMTVASGVTVQ